MRVCWFEQTVAEVPCEDDWLSAPERAKFDGMRIPKRRRDWRLGRWTAKHAVAAYLSLPVEASELAAIEIRPAASGAPEVFIGELASEVSISLTHRDGRAVCAVAPAGSALGCDLEIVEPRSDAFVSDYFTSREKDFVSRAAHADRFLGLALLWSAKESTLKALREGLRINTRQVDVDLPEGLSGGTKYREDAWRPMRTSFEQGIFHGWWRQEGEVVLTLVCEPATDPPLRLSVAPQPSCHLT